jgi:hypothetical protein
MKQYVVDQLRFPDHEKLRACLDQDFGAADMGQIYWVPLDGETLTPVQAEHLDCQPFFAALELHAGHLSLELLVRTKNCIRCDCIGYATEVQRNLLIRRVDDMLAQLGIVV